MMDMLSQILIFAIFIFFGSIPVIFLKSKHKAILTMIFGALIGLAAMHDYSRGKDLFFSLIKYTAIATVSSIIISTFSKKEINPEDLMRRVEYLEGRLNAVINALKSKEILRKIDEKIWIEKFGENFELFKRDKYFDYYKVWGNKGKYILKIDRETGYLAGYEKVSIFPWMLNILRISLPVILLGYLSFNAYLGYKEGKSITFGKLMSGIAPLFKASGISKIPFEETKNCSMPMMDVLLAVYRNQTSLEPINESAVKIILNETEFLAVMSDQELCIYEAGLKCGCINLTTLGGIYPGEIT